MENNKENKKEVNIGFTKTNVIHTYEQKPSVKLQFSNRLNESYDVIVEDIPVCEYHDTVADKVNRALNPNVDTSNLTYGIARTLAPKTALINKMKADIDNANRELYNGMLAEQQRLLELEQKGINPVPVKKDDEKKEETENVK